MKLFSKIVTMTYFRLSAVLIALFFVGAQDVFSFTHKKIPVNFLEYQDETFALAKEESKPVFMLISAVWCHWCHVFEEEALADEKVYSYLNKNYINVFIDADARRDLHVKYQVNVLPYIVFLNPDGSILRKYGGVLDADDFLGFIKTLHKQVASGKPGEANRDEPKFSYSPPSQFDADKIGEIDSIFREIFLENFDKEEYGLGGAKKYILPETFIYLLGNVKAKENEFAGMIDNTLKKAVSAIYDPVEGGFFRYAETHDWRIAHYEKMLDVNSSALLLLLKANEMNPSDPLSDAARGTVDYLSGSLFDNEVGAFMSFQVADTSYYLLSANRRAKREKPAVIKKVFVDALSLSLAHLLDSSRSMRDDKFDEKVERSIQFLTDMVDKEKNLSHYYLPDEKKWLIEGTLADHANLALLLAKSYTISKKPERLRAARKILGYARAKYFDDKLGIYHEGSLADLPSLEYILGLNSIIARAWLEMPKVDRDREGNKIVKNILQYFSGMADLLSERAWDARGFRFMEAYAGYLLAAKQYAGK